MATKNWLTDHLFQHTENKQKFHPTYPNDKGLEYVPSLQEIDIPWGRARE